MTDASNGTRTSPLRILLLLLGAAGVVAFFASGAYEHLDARRVHGHILGLGPFGPAVYLLAFAVLQPLGPSGHIFTIAASMVWEPPVAFLLGLAGAVLSQVTSFLFYRYVAAEFARRHLPDRLLAYEQKLVERPVRTVLLLRIFLFTWPLVSMLLGVSRLRFLPMVGATALGLAPGVALDVWLGGAVMNWLAS